MAARALALLACTSTASCVTQNVHFEPPDNYPPSIETPADLAGARPLGQIIRLSILQAADGGTGSDILELPVEVRDPNVGELLTLRAFVNPNPATPSPGQQVDDFDIAADGDRVARRPRPVRIPIGSLDQACNRVDLLVVGQDGFKRAPDIREPNRPNDLGTAYWLVINDRDFSDVSISDCSAWFAR